MKGHYKLKSQLLAALNPCHPIEYISYAAAIDLEPVSVENFKNHVRQRHMQDNEIFTKEYKVSNRQGCSYYKGRGDSCPSQKNSNS